MMIVKGESLSPREVEEVLYMHDEVQECAVIGLPDEKYGEKLVAYIVERAGMTIDREQLKVFMKQQLASEKMPRAFITLPQLPKSGTGKLMKRELKQLVLSNEIPCE